MNRIGWKAKDKTESMMVPALRNLLTFTLGMVHNKTAVTMASETVDTIIGHSTNVDPNARASALSIDSRHTDSIEQFIQLYENAKTMERKDEIAQSLGFTAPELAVDAIKFVTASSIPISTLISCFKAMVFISG